MWSKLGVWMIPRDVKRDRRRERREEVLVDGRGPWRGAKGNQLGCLYFMSDQRVSCGRRADYMSNQSWQNLHHSPAGHLRVEFTQYEILLAPRWGLQSNMCLHITRFLQRCILSSVDPSILQFCQAYVHSHIIVQKRELMFGNWGPSTLCISMQFLIHDPFQMTNPYAVLVPAVPSM